MNTRSDNRDRDAVIEECAQFIEGGRFLHDDAPAARLAREAAKAMREQLKRNPATSSPEPPAAAGGGLKLETTEEVRAEIERLAASRGVLHWAALGGLCRDHAHLTSEVARLTRERDEQKGQADKWFTTHLSHLSAGEALGKANGELFKRAYEDRQRAEKAEAALASANALAATAREEERKAVVDWLLAFGTTRTNCAYIANAIGRGDHLPPTGSEADDSGSNLGGGK